MGIFFDKTFLKQDRCGSYPRLGSPQNKEELNLQHGLNPPRIVSQSTWCNKIQSWSSQSFYIGATTSGTFTSASYPLSYPPLNQIFTVGIDAFPIINISNPSDSNNQLLQGTWVMSVTGQILDISGAVAYEMSQSMTCTHTGSWPSPPPYGDIWDYSPVTFPSPIMKTINGISAVRIITSKSSPYEPPGAVAQMSFSVSVPLIHIEQVSNAIPGIV